MILLHSFRQKLCGHRELFDEKYLGYSAFPTEFFPDEMKQTCSFEFNNEVSQESVSKNLFHQFSISRLRKFLESPSQSTAINLLGMSEDEDEIFKKKQMSLWN